MAKRGQAKSRAQTDEDFGLDEVDSFHAEREKILLNEAGPSRQRDEDEDSDEEVLGVSDASDSEEDDEAEFFGKKDEEDVEDEEDEGAWGSTKGAYYGADDLDDEESAKLIEEEALRQQKRHLEELNMDDFVDEEVEEEWKKSAKKHDFGSTDASSNKTLQTFQSISQLDPKAKRKYISTSHPEFIPLSKELSKLKPTLDDLKERKDENEVLNVKFTALSAYLGAISSYFAVFLALLKEEEPFTMKEHPVMECILSSKEVWRQASELYEDDVSLSDDEKYNTKALDNSENNSSEDVSDNDEDVFDSASESMGEAEQDEEESEVEIDISKPRNFKKVKSQAQEDFAEGEIADVDAEEKKTRKRTLRFYTSKIDQQAKKNDERYTGDLDIPYKERLFERQQRLIEEARKRGQHDDNGEDLDAENDYDSQDEKDAREVNADNDSYYNTIKSSKIKEKSQRIDAHNQAVRAAKEGKLAELQENLGEDGKRALNYQILKNKGLTPHRNKDNRNSRVKKRKKYEKAQKKLKSTRAVYSQPSGPYEGEKTGIKKNLTRSTKF